MDFSNKIIVVTGAAGNLGQAVTRAYLAAGGQVCALDHRAGRLSDIFRDADDKGRLHIYENVDVLDRDGLVGLAEVIRKDLGTASILVHTVGRYAAGEQVHQISSDAWQKMMDLNVRSFLTASAAFAPDIIDSGEGKIITIGAKAALTGGAKAGAYSAAKAALLRLTESISAELKSHNVQVNCVIPSVIDTPENRQAMPGADFSKWVSPDKIASVILFLTSPEADIITGAAIPVFG